jgi:hypothetical protein
MNQHVQPGVSGNALACVVTSQTFSTMASDYDAAYNSVNNEADGELAEKLYDMSSAIAEKMTKPDVPMDRSDEVALAKIILAQADGDSGVFNDSTVEAFVLKLAKNIVASVDAPSIYETRGFFEP